MQSDAEASGESEIDDLRQRNRLLTQFIVPAYWNLLDRVQDGQPVVDISCLACDYTATATTFVVRTDQCDFGGGRLDRHLCPRCGCVFGPRKYLELPPELISADYALLYQDYQESVEIGYELRAFDALSPVGGLPYLDWGCGSRTDPIEVLRARGYDVWGYEPNVDNASPFVARSRAEVTGAFAGIFSSNLIEHLTDPFTQFLDFRSMLQPGARMAHASACYEWRYVNTRFHVFFPMGTAPAELAARTGFRVVSEEHDGEFIVVVFEAI
jgi:hypothetical protein